MLPLMEVEESSSSTQIKTKLTLSATLRHFAPKNIFDVHYMELDGGTPCLLLCLPGDNRIMAVEMIGGRTRWEAGTKQMGNKFKPYSNLHGLKNDCVYVADHGQNKIHLLSATDGTVIKRFDPGNLSIRNIFSVRFHDQHLYVEHVQTSPNKNTPSASLKKSTNSN